MNLLQIPLCMLGRHRRSRKKAYYDFEGIRRSVCTGCGRKMERFHTGWQLSQPDGDK